MAEKKGVYRHVVLFGFKPSAGPDTVAAIETAFRAFCTRLPFVTDYEWGRNSSPEGLDQGFTHCFIVSFAGPEGRDAYLPHPEHRAFIATHLDPHLDKVCVVDFAAND
jgi:hypothetical protein